MLAHAHCVKTTIAVSMAASIAASMAASVADHQGRPTPESSFLMHIWDRERFPKRTLHLFASISGRVKTWKGEFHLEQSLPFCCSDHNTWALMKHPSEFTENGRAEWLIRGTSRRDFLGGTSLK